MSDLDSVIEVFSRRFERMKLSKAQKKKIYQLLRWAEAQHQRETDDGV